MNDDGAIRVTAGLSDEIETASAHRIRLLQPLTSEQQRTGLRGAGATGVSRPDSACLTRPSVVGSTAGPP
jgi:hypothetical protein